MRHDGTIRAFIGVLGIMLLVLGARQGTAQETPNAAPAEQATGAQAAGEATAQVPGQDVDSADLLRGVTREEEEALRLVDEILREQQNLLTGQNFVYREESRRDPFRNLLLLRRRGISAPQQRPAGLAGFLVNEITLQAIAEFQGRRHVMILGVDRRTYFARVGDRLYDGRIVEIRPGEVVFEQEVEDLLGARATRQVIKQLNSVTEEQVDR